MHPSPEITALIMHRLAAIETREGVRILLAVESGSRAWGFASADSDYDVRFIYVRRPADYVRLKPVRDVIEEPLEGDLDISGWDLLKAARLLTKSNAAIFEWMESPIVYRRDAAFMEGFGAEAIKQFSLRVAGEHYLRVFERNYDDYIHGRAQVIRKKYLYAVRPIAALEYLLGCGTFPPTAFPRTREQVDFPPEVRADMASLLEAKRTGTEMGEGEPLAGLNRFLAESAAKLRGRINALPDPHRSAESLEHFVQRTIGV